MTASTETDKFDPEPRAAAVGATAPAGRKRVLIAVDDSKPAEWAVQVGGQLAGETGARVAVLHVVPPPLSVSAELAYVEDELARRRLLEKAEGLLEGARRMLPRAAEAEKVLREGAAPEEIVAAAHDWRADLVVLGTRGRGRLAHFLLGSTAEAVVRRAPCPVVTVGHDPADHPADHPAEQQREPRGGDALLTAATSV
jgi:nucleotide-binding universal stress UspA family protein